MGQNISNNNFNNNMNNFLNNNFNHIGFGLNTQNSLDNNEELWMKGFRMAVKEVNSFKFIFKTTIGIQTHVTVGFGTTISQLLEKYLKIVNREYLIGNTKIFFIYIGNKLNFGDHTLVEKYFNNYNFDSNIFISINDLFNYIGGKEKYITFKGSKGIINNFNFAENLSINELIKYFFKSIEKENLIIIGNIIFYYFFKYLKYPLINLINLFFPFKR